jgi:hypothetical protein
MSDGVGAAGVGIDAGAAGVVTDAGATPVAVCGGVTGSCLVFVQGNSLLNLEKLSQHILKFNNAE